VRASWAGESSMTTRWPMPAAVALPDSLPPARTPTRQPSSAHSRATALPTMPAPTTRTSNDFMSELYPGCEWIVVAERGVLIRR
jgi:hypothetical protein